MSIKKIKVRGKGFDADSLDLWCVKWCENAMRHSSLIFVRSGIRERKPMLWQKIWKRNSRHFFKHQVDTVITILLKTPGVLINFCFKTDICWIDPIDSLLSGKFYHPYMINPLPWVDKSQFHKYQICWTFFWGGGLVICIPLIPLHFPYCTYLPPQACLKASWSLNLFSIS